MEARVSHGTEFFLLNKLKMKRKEAPDFFIYHATISKHRRHIRDRIINYTQFFQKNIEKQKLLNMTKPINYLLPTILLLLVLFGFLFFKRSIAGENISITISENKDEVRISGYFPKTKSKAVRHFLRKKLNLTDLANLNYLEIKDYSTPDKLLRCYIKIRPESVKILLDKNKNDSDGYAIIKETGEELKKVLAEQQ
jgi:hypothetical protein